MENISESAATRENQARVPAQPEPPARHSERVLRVVQQHDTTDADVDEVRLSWLRSADEGIDPEKAGAPQILTSGEVRETREPLDHLIHCARDDLDRLYKAVGPAGYTVLFCDRDGIAVDHRGDERDAERFRYWGTWLGGVWSEAVEGTNGIGTCIVEERPVTIHRGQHYRARHAELSCSGAPIFGVDGRLLAVVDVSAIDPDRSEQAHALTGAMTIAAARSAEERFFRDRFRKEWILATMARAPDDAGALLAIDGNFRIVGANRAARTGFLLDDERLAKGVCLWRLFERDTMLFQRQETGDLPTVLALQGSSEHWPAILTAPERPSDAWRNSALTALHTRPRLDAVAALALLAPAPPARGGLPSNTMRRLDDYIEAHLGDRIDLADLAAIAALSTFHFARQFRETTGVTPHFYLIRKRLECARELLARDDLSLGAIAALTGFSDQSHFTRQFGQMFGMTPGQFRRSRGDSATR